MLQLGPDQTDRSIAMTCQRNRFLSCPSIHLLSASMSLALTATLYAAPPDGKGGGNGGGGGRDGGGEPPTNPELAYLEEGDVWVAAADGSNQTEVFSDGWVYWNSWSPDGAQLALMADIDGLIGIWTVDADGSNMQLVTYIHVASFLFDIQWSPAPTADGQEKILFINLTSEDADGTFDVYAINPDGAGLVHLVDTPLPVMERSCTWSPDASRIAVIDGASDSMIVYDLGLVDGSLAVTGTSEVANLPPDLHQADWARTKNQIALSSFVPGSADNRELWIIDLDDSTACWQITSNGDYDGYPTWSPDDSHVAYARSTRSRKEKGIRKVTSDGQTDGGTRPDWRRVAPAVARIAAQDANVCAEDLTEDGIVDAQDLIALLTGRPDLVASRIGLLVQSWGDCP
jgi:Tol biopolymer transport system component